MIGIEHEVSRDLKEAGRAHHGFALFYILFLEEKLSIEVGEVYGIQIEERDVTKACQDDVFDWIQRSVRKAGLVKSSDGRSSQPIPPAPTNKTLVSARRLTSSGPRIASAWA